MVLQLMRRWGSTCVGFGIVRMQEVVVFMLYFYIADKRDCFFFWCITFAMEGDRNFRTASLVMPSVRDCFTYSSKHSTYYSSPLDVMVN